MNLQHIYNLCTQLQSISGTKAKQQFLLDNRCDDFDTFLEWLLDPQIVTGIDKKKLKKKTTAKPPFWLYYDIAFIFDYLKKTIRGEMLMLLYARNISRSIPTTPTS